MSAAALNIPHILILSQSNPDDWDSPDGVNEWDDVEITCLHEPSELMPCAVWVRCGCEPVVYEDFETGWYWGLELDEIDPLIGHPGQGPCPRAASGEHRYWEGEPCRPDAECWPVRHADVDALRDAATDLALPPGRYEVFPRPDGDGGMELPLSPSGGAR